MNRPNSTAENVPKIAELKLSSCGIAIADSKKSCACPPLEILHKEVCRRSHFNFRPLGPPGGLECGGEVVGRLLQPGHAQQPVTRGTVHVHRVPTNTCTLGMPRYNLVGTFLYVCTSNLSFKSTLLLLNYLRNFCN
jgi:hypothetical protein